MLYYNNKCLPHYFRPAHYVQLEPEQRELLRAGYYFCHYSRIDEQQWFSSLLPIHVFLALQLKRYYKDLLTEGPCQTTCFTSCICVACDCRPLAHYIACVKGGLLQTTIG